MSISAWSFVKIRQERESVFESEFSSAPRRRRSQAQRLLLNRRRSIQGDFRRNFPVASKISLHFYYPLPASVRRVLIQTSVYVTFPDAPPRSEGGGVFHGCQDVLSCWSSTAGATPFSWSSGTPIPAVSGLLRPLPLPRTPSLYFPRLHLPGLYSDHFPITR